MKKTVIAITNQKGGTGKSTSALNIGAALARSGKSVLLIDCDPSGNLTDIAGVYDPEKTVADILNNKYKSSQAEKVILRLAAGYDLIPSDIRTADADSDDPRALKTALKTLNYDYIILDMAPALQKMEAQALTAADYVLIPVSPQPLPMKGIPEIFATVDMIRRNTNAKLKVLGILITLADTRRAMDRAMIEQIREAYPDLTFPDIIKSNSKVAESTYFQKNIFDYDPNGAATQTYRQIAEEIERRI